MPSWLNDLRIDKLSVNRSIIIDINPGFPFQFTSVDGSGAKLHLVKAHQFGLWSGNLTVNAAEATLNKTDLRHPSTVINADEHQIIFSDTSAFTPTGLLEGQATVGQELSRPLSLTLSGRNVAVDVLQNWGWRQVPLQGDGNLALVLKGNLKGADKKPDLTGSLTVTSGDGQQLIQRYPATQEQEPAAPLGAPVESAPAQEPLF